MVSWWAGGSCCPVAASGSCFRLLLLFGGLIGSHLEPNAKFQDQIEVRPAARQPTGWTVDGSGSSGSRLRFV